MVLVPKKKVPLIFGNSHFFFWGGVDGLRIRIEFRVRGSFGRILLKGYHKSYTPGYVSGL